MPEKIVHPDWLAVGQVVQTVQYGIAGHVHRRADVVVVRHTPTSIVVKYPSTGAGTVWDTTYRYALKGQRYVLTPRYLDYRDVLEPKEETHG